jgi:flavin-dependent dehydrogenase
MHRGELFQLLLNEVPQADVFTNSRFRRLSRNGDRPIACFEDGLEVTALTSWVDSRATLVGDAAHPIEPSLGMGACLAIEDALVLGARLERTSRIDDALAMYERTRRPRVARMVRWSKWLARSEQVEQPIVCA